MSKIELKIANVRDIRDASLNTSNILPQKLKGYVAQMRSNGRGALSYKGGFCVSIKLIKSGGKPQCMRCWCEVGVLINKEQIDYLEKVSSLLKNEQDCGYFVNFEIIPDFLRVKEDVIPGLLMDWVEGDTLNNYVHRDNGKSGKDIGDIADKFLKMCDYLNKKNISHGDLSAVNIIVTEDKKLKLIDYDSIYTASMGDKPQFISGIDDYQHPKRKEQPYYRTYTDYFSQHVIYTALLMMSLDDSLRPEEKDSKILLFESQNFATPEAFANSDVVKKGYRLKNPTVTAELGILEKSISLPFDKVPPLLSKENFAERTKPKSEDISTIVGALEKNPETKGRYCAYCNFDIGSAYPNANNCPNCGAPRITYRLNG